MDAKLMPSNVVKALGRSVAQEFDELFKHVQKYFIIYFGNEQLKEGKFIGRGQNAPSYLCHKATVPRV